MNRRFSFMLLRSFKAFTVAPKAAEISRFEAEKEERNHLSSKLISISKQSL